MRSIVIDNVDLMSEDEEKELKAALKRLNVEFTEFINHHVLEPQTHEEMVKMLEGMLRRAKEKY